MRLGKQCSLVEKCNLSERGTGLSGFGVQVLEKVGGSYKLGLDFSLERYKCRCLEPRTFPEIISLRCAGEAIMMSCLSAELDSSVSASGICVYHFP